MEVLNLGSQPPSNALLTDPNTLEEYYPLRLVVCRACYLLQLDYDVPHAQLFDSSYPYFSGQSAAWVEHCKQYVEMITKRLGIGKDSAVVEIGGNDGTLLKNFKKGGSGSKAVASETPFFLCSIDPSESVAEAAAKNGVGTIRKGFGRDTRLPYKANLLIANNVLAHDPDLRGLVEGVAANLEIAGTFTAEFPWALNLIEQTQFDTIYHEHYSYFTLHALVPLFIEFGLRIYDVEELPTHGGSLRIYASATGAHEVKSSVMDLMAREAALLKMETYWKFRERAYALRADFEAFLWGKEIYAYGAAAKGNTFLNWLRIEQGILAVGDTTPAKIGKFLPGTHIPVISEEEMLSKRPEYVLILPWNWASTIVDKLHCIRGWGGQFVTAIPELRVF